MLVQFEKKRWQRKEAWKKQLLLTGTLKAQ